MNFDKITSYLDSLEKEGIPSLDFMICKDHKVIYRHFCGYADAERTRKIDGTELYLMFSATKIVTMTAVMQLVEKNLLDLEKEVGDYLPAYKELYVKKDDVVEKAKKPLLVKHLVSMQSGLDYDINRPGILRVLDELGSQATTIDFVNSFIESPLKFEPGEHFEYSLSHDVIGAIIEVVSGMKLSEYFKKYIFEPLEMKDTFFAKPMNHHERLVSQYMYDGENKVSNPMEPSCCYQFTDSYESAGAGLISSVEDYSKFADALACGGISAKGVRVLHPESIEIMRSNLLGELQRDDLVRTMGRVGFGYGCGVEIMMEPEKAKEATPIGVFGWDSAGGALVMMEPEEKISFVYAQLVRNCGYAYGTIHPALRSLVFEVE